MITRYVLISRQSNSRSFYSGWHLSRKNVFVYSLGVLLLTLLLFGVKSILANNGGQTRLSSNSSRSIVKPGQKSPLNSYIQAATQSSSSTSIDLHSKSTTSSNPSKNTAKTKLTVNGSDVPVSGNSIHKSFHSNDGNTSINISVDNSTSSSGKAGGM